MTRDEEALLSALGYVGAGTLASVGEAIAAPPRKPDSPIAPPAPLIGAVWTALFACFGVARAKLRGLPRERRLVDALWLMCVTYPLYTDGIRSRGAAYVGTR
jgi:tryptophan-rich sensory protein